MIERVTNWTAKRSGAGITIECIGTDGEPRRLTGIDAIEAGDGGLPPTAIDRSGVRYELR